MGRTLCRAPAPADLHRAWPNDPVLPFDRMERFQARLKAFGLNVTWLPFDGDHAIPDEVVAGMNAFIRGVFQRDTPF